MTFPVFRIVVKNGLADPSDPKSDFFLVMVTLGQLINRDAGGRHKNCAGVLGPGARDPFPSKGGVWGGRACHGRPQ